MSDFNPETLLIITPTITLGTAVFNYVYNTFRNENLEFSLRGVLTFLGSSLIYSILLGVFTYFFYKLVIENVYYRVKNYVLNPIQKLES